MGKGMERKKESKKKPLKTLKEKLMDPVNQYWPVLSIAFDSLRNGSLPLSLNTWYKYANRWE